MEKNQDIERKQKRYEEFICQARKQMAIFEHLLDKFKLDELNEQLGNKATKQEKLNDCFIKLSRREAEILYYLSLNKSPKEIAVILSEKDKKTISSATIQAVINKQLYHKLGVRNVGQLIEKAILMNLIPFLPDN